MRVRANTGPITVIQSIIVAVGQVWDLSDPAGGGVRRITVKALQMGPTGPVVRGVDARGKQSMTGLCRFEKADRCKLVSAAAA